MQCNQPIFYTGPPQYTQFLSNNTPVPQQYNPTYPDVIGEGEIATVILPDGSAQYFFLPIYKWSQFMQNANLANCNPYWNPATGAWYIRGFSNPYSFNGLQPNLPFGPQRSGFPCSSNIALPPAGFQIKFHSDGDTSTTDLCHFCPRSQSAVKSPHARNARPNVCSGVQVHIPEVRNTPCQPDIAEEPRNDTRDSKQTENSNTQTNKVTCECHKDRRGARNDSLMSVDDVDKSKKRRGRRTDCECYSSTEDMSIDQTTRHGKKYEKDYATYSDTTSISSQCSTCLTDKRKIKDLKALEKEQRKREKEAKKREKEWLKKVKERENARRKQQEKYRWDYDSDETSTCTCMSVDLNDIYSTTTYSKSTDIEMGSGNDTAETKLEKDLSQREKDFIKTLEMDRMRLEQEKKRLEQEKNDLEIKKSQLEKKKQRAMSNKPLVICECDSKENGNQKADTNVKEQKEKTDTDEHRSSACCSLSPIEVVLSSVLSSLCSDTEMSSGKDTTETKRERELIKREKKFLKTLEMEKKRLEEEKNKLEREKMDLEIEKEQLRAKASHVICECHSKENADNKQSNKSMKGDGSDVCCSTNTHSSSLKDIFTSVQNSSCNDIEMSSDKDTIDTKREKELMKHEKQFLKTLAMEQKRLEEEKSKLEKQKLEIVNKIEKHQKSKPSFICECESETNANQKGDSYASAMSIVDNVDVNTNKPCNVLMPSSESPDLNCICGPSSDGPVESSPKETGCVKEESTNQARGAVFPFVTNLSGFSSYKSCLENISNELCKQSFDDHIEFD